MPSSPAAARRPPVVLIGDAQEWFARALETVLVQGGYGVVKAYTASTLLQQLERAAPAARRGPGGAVPHGVAQP